MTITPIRGDRQATNRASLKVAMREQPSLLVDCSRAANPYSLPAVTPEDFHDVFVVEVEMLYKFRDTVRELPGFLRETGSETVVVTDTSMLFDYDDSTETRMVRRNAGKRLQYLAQQVAVYVVNPSKNGFVS